jgi:hypothetical protein
MIFQLPTGAIVHISLEQYLDLTHEDIQYLISIGNSASPNNPFHNSELSKPTSVRDDLMQEMHDTTIDYDRDVEDDCPERTDINNLPEDL